MTKTTLAGGWCLMLLTASPACRSEEAEAANATGVKRSPEVWLASLHMDTLLALYADSLEFAKMLKAHVDPDPYMVQSWFEHPSRDEILVPENEPGSFLNLAKEVILLAKDEEASKAKKMHP
jgi:hypothetical protein